jgi:hypothetical protein
MSDTATSKAHRSRAISLGAPIALCLAILATAIVQHKFSAIGAALETGTTELVVSSSRDAGPDSLRDAILAADRLSTRARIVITAKRILIESALPALVNPRGVDIEAASGAGSLDASHQEGGAALQIDSPTTTLKGLHISHARVSAIIVNAPGVQFDSIAVSDSKVGLLMNAAAKSCAVRTSTFERNETAVMAQAGVRRAAILSSIFRDNARAGVWFVGREDTHADRDDQPGLRVADSVFERNAIGIVTNQPTVVQKARFLGNRESAIVILGGAARLEDSEIRASGGTAISVTSGTGVAVVHNTLIDNAAAAISARDSEVEIERNTLDHNGLGIVSVISHDPSSTIIEDNLITRTTADAVTLIGGAPLLRRNRIVRNQGAGLRTLDLAHDGGALKVSPRLEANVVEGNRVNTPLTGVYTLSGSL